MSDRKKVIKGLECCFNPHSDNSCFCKCTECPYDTDCHEWSVECQIQLNRDALALLKEQQKRIEQLELEKGWDESPDMMGKW